MVGKLKKKRNRKKLVHEAKELEADPSLPKKRLPKNGVVKMFEEKKKKLYHDFFFYAELSRNRTLGIK